MCSTMLDEIIYSELAVPRWLQGSPDAPGLPAAISGPALVANRVVQLRPFRLEDARPMYEAAHESMDQLAAWMTWCRPDYSLAEAEAFVSQCGRAWQRGEHCSFAIIDSHNQNFLGSVGLNQLNHTHKFGNVGYWVRSAEAGRGVATSATRLAAAFGLNELGLQRLEFLIPAINVASQRVAQKIGAKFEGILRSRLLISGRSHDAAMYSLTKADI